MGIEDYKKRVQAVVKGLDGCRYGVCTKCDYKNDGCQNRLFSEASEYLSDYLKNLKDLRDV